MQKNYCQQKPTELLQSAVDTAATAVNVMLEHDPHMRLEQSAVEQPQPTVTQHLLDALGAAISAAGTLLRGTDVVRRASHCLSNSAQRLPCTTHNRI